MKILGVALIVLGILALVYGGIAYNREKTVLEVGSLKATATEHKTIPVPPIVGAAALIAGILVLVVPGRSLRKA